MQASLSRAHASAIRQLRTFPLYSICRYAGQARYAVRGLQGSQVALIFIIRVYYGTVL